MRIIFFQFLLHLMNLEGRVPRRVYTVESIRLEEILRDEELCRLPTPI